MLADESMVLARTIGLRWSFGHSGSEFRCRGWRGMHRLRWHLTYIQVMHNLRSTKTTPYCHSCLDMLSKEDTSSSSQKRSTITRLSTSLQTTIRTLLVSSLSIP
ncbi:hypothetical protein M404DRAFT_821285 [Pisolithus tinctorius Marx 270]|uniref:Uncharacterized protein n=1 Tax=Pisolithus tinctorius Marx 270 TaxID=870435 RepID=A0A0C3JNL6_PISTI|nr:hypothetical protein M404DRAFT_821285 [Pisolithus tinctorius Marx 270]